MAALVTLVLGIPTTIWSASWWARGVEASIKEVSTEMAASIQTINVRDSAMVAVLDDAIAELGRHKTADEARDAALSVAVQEISVTMEGVVALQGVERLAVVLGCRHRPSQRSRDA